jgi:hypothetical protein
MHHENFDDPVIRLRLLEAELQRMQGSWAVEHTEVGVASLREQVQEYVEGGPPLRKWWRRHQVASILHREAWVSPQLRETIAPVLWPTAVERLRHPILGGQTAGPGGSESRPLALDLAWIEAAVEGGRVDRLPAVVESFAPAARLDGVRLALVAHAPTADLRFSMMSAVAAHGEAEARRRAIGLLIDILRHRQVAYRAVAAFVVQGPAAFPSVGWLLEPSIVDDDSLVRVAAGLPLDPPATKR